MNLQTLLLEDFEREGACTRRVPERVPAGRNDWRPHAKSMPRGYLAALVANMPSWTTLMLERDQFDVVTEGRQFRPALQDDAAGLVALLDRSLATARAASPLSH